jgi:signal transduction histidine kinase
MSEWVVLDIEDHGAGISEEDLENVTKKFYKGSSKRSGSGLGLAISDEIVRLHGGELRIMSTLDMGTTVQVLLPHVTEDKMDV